MLVLVATALLAAHRALADEGNGEKSEGEQAKSVCKPPAPRTVWQAIHAYCNRLRYGPPPPEKKQEEAKEKVRSEEKDKKEANGKKTESEDLPMPKSCDENGQSKKANGADQKTKNGDKKEAQDKYKEKDEDTDKEPEPPGIAVTPRPRWTPRSMGLFIRLMLDRTAFRHSKRSIHP
jgi:hypothetical protein